MQWIVKGINSFRTQEQKLAQLAKLDDANFQRQKCRVNACRGALTSL